MIFGSKKNRRVEIMEASIEEDIKKTIEDDMEEDEEDDMLGAQVDHLPI